MSSSSCQVRLIAGLLGVLACSSDSPAASAYRFEWLTPSLPASVPYDINEAGLVVGECGLGLRACLIDGTVVEDIHPTAARHSSSRARAVNEAGNVAIESGGASPSSFHEAWLWDGASHLQIRPDGTALDLNDADLVVGEDNAGRPWAWTSSGGLVDLAPLVGMPQARVTAVNDSGHFAGVALDGTGPNERIFYHDGLTLHEITVGLPSTGPRGYAARMNAVGQFVGAIAADGPPHAFVYDVRIDAARDIHPTSGPLAGLETSWAHDVNDLGQIVGSACCPGHNRAMLIEDGVATDLEDLMPSAMDESEATAINDAGVIVGFAAVAGTYLQGFRLTPIDLDASLRVVPRTLNIGILLGSLTARLTVAPDLRDSVDLASIELRSLGGRRIPGGLRPASISVPGRGLIHARFDKRALQPAIDAVRPQIGSSLALTFAGRLDDGSTFVLADAVKVVGMEIAGPARPRRPRL